jgi:hypothetical protein
MITRYYATQVKNTFLDYDPKTFPDFANQIYLDLGASKKKWDKN